jgi:hypothetical protein
MLDKYQTFIRKHLSQAGKKSKARLGSPEIHRTDAELLPDYRVK